MEDKKAIWTIVSRPKPRNNWVNASNMADFLLSPAEPDDVLQLGLNHCLQGSQFPTEYKETT